ncbi:type ISP restriction/modification enzyme [Qipengyuania sp. DSG2-2]|uniref:type ISP restriction/modification enzyme n=1 Tax=Qipengyuania sp. DGS2-2 TaxID=3349631 RepID=UPI0036D2BDA2
MSLAKDYFEAVHAAARGSVDAEEEAQLTTPVEKLFTGLCEQADLGTLQLIRETRTGRTRPDFAALLTRNRKTMQKGFVELKAPSISVDTATWSGRNATQWTRMSEEAEILIVCNGREAQLYRGVLEQGPPASLPYDHADGWDAQPLIDLLNRFFELNPSPIRAIGDLTKRLAVRTRDLRDRIEWLLDEADGPANSEAQGSYAAWRRHVFPDASQRDFADGVAQTIAYGMVLAALTPGNADADGDGHLTVGEARDAIRAISPVLAAAFAPLLDKPVLRDATTVEVGALETLVSAIEPDRIATPDRRGDAWLRFYEDFLSVYDPQERKEAGVYYTPVDAVAAMTAITGHLLVERFGKRMGFGDASVVTLDPATGTGTFPLAAIERAVLRAPDVRGPGGEQQAARNLAANMYAFELLPGPYAVAHLRLSQLLSELAGEPTFANVVLTDTLEAPDESAVSPADFFGDQQVLAEEQERANRIKREKKVTVVIGNPPYRRVSGDLRGRGSGGWVLEGQVEGRNSENSLFDDILDVAKAHTIFSHHASLYNLYVYFWRWALWKAFEAHEDGPGIVTFITGSSWLTGPGFVGLRQYARELADEIWVLDLGGDNKGANPEDNIFAIETPVAIVTLVRDDATDKNTPAPVNYRRIRGTSEAKLAALRAVADADSPFDGEWDRAPDGWLAPMVPPTGDAAWTEMPLITDMFPWQQPGCMHSRTWPVSPSVSILNERWEKFRNASIDERPELYVTPTHGRNIETKVGDRKKLIDLKPSDDPEPTVQFGMRSFDRQWSFNDPRLAKTDSPSLWQSLSNRQIFFASLLTGKIGQGPALTSTTGVPDKHFFRGSYGAKDIIPLYRDAAASEPNITSGLPATLAVVLGLEPPYPEDIAAYTYALLANHAYQQRFAEALQTPGLRVPLTADAGLWAEAVAAGRELLWLHTYAERFVDPSAGRGAHVPSVEGLGWTRAVTRMPHDNGDIAYDTEEGTITIGDGQVGGVREEVWKFSVSGMQVVPKWLGYRTRKGTGRATSSTSALDYIRPSQWADEWNDELLDLLRILTITLDREDLLADLLARICDGELIPAEDLPHPADEERKPPPTL